MVAHHVGLGGVHRGAEHSMDISADLTELGELAVHSRMLMTFAQAEHQWQWCALV